MSTNTGCRVLEVVPIKDLYPELYDGVVIGIIIAKQKPRIFGNNASTSNLLQNQAVWNFTIRDSPRDYINVTYWESSTVIKTVYERFSTGDIVELTKPKVGIRRLEFRSEQYRPLVTSPYSLTLGEQSEMYQHSGDPTAYLRLLPLPTKPIAGFVPIRDLHSEQMRGRSVDLLGAVRGVGEWRSVTTRAGQATQVCEAVLFDCTSAGIKVTIWEDDVILSAAKWVPRATIVFMTDVRVEWSSFNRCFVASLTRKSIVTENPVGEEAARLAQYAASAELPPSSLLDQNIAVLPDANSIQNVMCVKGFTQQAANFFQSSQTNKELTALLFVFVTKLDLDGLTPCMRVKCGICRQWMRTERDMCQNRDCVNFQHVPTELSVAFELKVDLADHSGTLENCRLFGDTAERIIGCSVQRFLKMTNEDKCILKWKYLLERCAVKVCLTLMRNKPIVTIVSCELADPMEVAQKVSLV